MKGKVVLITGSTAGIGRQAALGLAKLGATLVLVGRDPKKAERVVEEVKTATGNPNVEYLLADLSSMQSIRDLAEKFRAKHARLDVLLNNAGGINMSREETVDGFERTFAVNHLAYFLLTTLLLPQLEAAKPSRVVNVSSAAHRYGPINFDDVMAKKRYLSWAVYGRSKLANILFTRELARRLEGKGVTVNALHPGFVASNFLEKGGFWSFIKPLAYLFAVNEEAGARTSVYLASSPEVEGVTGKYFYKNKVARTTRAGQDDIAARRLWELSEKLVG